MREGDRSRVELSPTGCAAAIIDATGLLMLPGRVDIHGDAFERQIMPRPGVTFPLGLALSPPGLELKWGYSE